MPSKKKPTEAAKMMETIRWIVSILMFIAAFAALTGVYKTHLVAGGATFGTTTASLSLIAFAITSHVWLKSLTMCCDNK